MSLGHADPFYRPKIKTVSKSWVLANEIGLLEIFLNSFPTSTILWPPPSPTQKEILEMPLLAPGLGLIHSEVHVPPKLWGERTDWVRDPGPCARGVAGPREDGEGKEEGSGVKCIPSMLWERLCRGSQERGVHRRCNWISLPAAPGSGWGLVWGEVSKIGRNVN